MICKSSKCQLLQSANYSLSLSQFERHFPEKNSARRVAFKRYQTERAVAFSSECPSLRNRNRPTNIVQSRNFVWFSLSEEHAIPRTVRLPTENAGASLFLSRLTRKNASGSSQNRSGSKPSQSIAQRAEDLFL